MCALLNLTLEELEYLSDYEGRERKQHNDKLLNYHYKWIPKKSGKRLIEVPKALLKEYQRRIQKLLTQHYQPHPAACAYIKGKKLTDFASPHTNQHIVLKMDIKDFFPSVRSYSVQHFFESQGFNHRVACFLTGLCTNVVPYKISMKAGHAYTNSHLPQGGPSSPALSSFREIDKRIAKAADKTGLKYTRYADDLAFSSQQNFNVNSFRNTITKILSEGQFKVNHRKTRIMGQGQRQALCQITVNEKINYSRQEYEKLKAILHNCQKFGPATQNRDNHPHFKLHLHGKIQYLKKLNPNKGKKLLELLEKISWL